MKIHLRSYIVNMVNFKRGGGILPLFQQVNTRVVAIFEILANMPSYLCHGVFSMWGKFLR